MLRALKGFTVDEDVVPLLSLQNIIAQIVQLW